MKFLPSPQIYTPSLHMSPVHNKHGSVTNTMCFKEMNQQSNHYKYQPIYPPWFDKSLLEHKIFYLPPKYIKSPN